MKYWVTEIRARCAVTGEVKTWCGPNVPAPNKRLAEEYCQLNGLGYCVVLGELICEIPCKGNEFEPDWSKVMDYDNHQWN